MDCLTKQTEEIRQYMDEIAPMRDKWIKLNSYYYEDLMKFFCFNIPENSSVLEIGSGTGEILNKLKPKRGVGIDISNEMLRIARQKYGHLEFIQMDAEDITLRDNFDYVIISDTLAYFNDIQKVFHQLKKVITVDTRIIITFHNFLWLPLLKIAENLGLKMPQKRLNWLNRYDVMNLLHLEAFEIIRTGNRLLFPRYIPFFSIFINKYIANLPFFNKLCITSYIVAKPIVKYPENNDLFSVSVVVPARNEKGNIENIVKRIPKMGEHTEIIFVEGHSTDKTLDETMKVYEKYSHELDIKFYVQDGKGKGDAVRKGFAMAKGDILMILDADLTVPPEELPKFYNAIATGLGEFINGSRLVYPMENEAMKTLNILTNKLFSLMFTFLLGQKFKDTLCGTKVLSRKNYDKIQTSRKFFGDFDPFGDFDLIFCSAKHNLKIIEIPIRYKARQYGHTNISRFRHGWLLLKMVIFAMRKIKFI
jgi:ubiquinone/menaquinone biosynthesis C-methylase UbiE